MRTEINYIMVDGGEIVATQCRIRPIDPALADADLFLSKASLPVLLINLVANFNYELTDVSAIS